VHRKRHMCIDQRYQERQRLSEQCQQFRHRGGHRQPATSTGLFNRAIANGTNTTAVARGNGFNLAYAGGESSTARAGGTGIPGVPAPQAFNVAIVQM
jgi:hypothetical protein